MAYTKWVIVLLVLLAGVDWAFTGTLDSLKATALVSGFTLGNVLGYIALILGAWSVYEMAMKK